MLADLGTYSSTPYAYVRWFKRAPVRGDQLESAGCIRVAYDTAGQRKQSVYEIIHLSSMVCRHHVVPDFKDEGGFYVSCFSPVRPT
eukprot:scaffold36321_cov25-Tisochrysis_lutea.AAC.1